MSLMRSKGTNSTTRSSLLVKLRLVNRSGEVLDEQEAWQQLVDAFKKHPTIDVYQAEVIPDYAK